MNRVKDFFIVVWLMISIVFHYLKRRPAVILGILFVVATGFILLTEAGYTVYQESFKLVKESDSNQIQILSVLVAVFGVWITFYTASTNWRREAINKVLMEINDKQSILCAEIANVVDKNTFLAKQIIEFSNNILQREPIHDLNIQSELLAKEIEGMKQRVEMTNNIYLHATTFKEQYNLIFIRKKIYHLLDGVITTLHDIRMESIALQVFLVPNEPQLYSDFAQRAVEMNLQSYIDRCEERRNHINMLSGMMRGVLLEELLKTSFRELWITLRSPQMLLTNYKVYNGERVSLKKRMFEFMNDLI